MVLRTGYLAVATRLQEAADMMHGDVRARLADAINDAHRDSGHWASYIDHSGDGESGDVIYSCDGDIRKCPYEIASQGGKATTHLDMENSTNVVPHTTYEEEADEDDHYASMMESFKAANIYTDLPVYERFISKGERDKADEGSFAGKGKSFPILKPSDVSAAVHAMGRAGPSNYGMAQLKANIIRIAKAKGWTSSLPKAWQGDDASEAYRPTVSRAVPQEQSIRLTEAAATLDMIRLQESRADYEIKLIAPGKGSSAFYPKEVLQRDGPKVFKAGTHVYLNHPTAAEEAARPEGDVANLAGVLSTDAAYHESHAKGPGLYARMKVFADHAQTVEEKAPHVGMSIRASGVAEANRKQDGLPVLKELTHAESVDVVTRAGAGGMILTEAARPETQEVDMTEQQISALIESAVQKATNPLRERALRGDAIVSAQRLLAPLALNEAAKQMVIDNCLRDVPIKENALDEDKFKELVTAEAKRVAAVVGQSLNLSEVRGMGTGAIPIDDPKDEKRRLKEAKRQRKLEELQQTETVSIFESLGMPKAAAAAAAKGRAA